MTEFPDERETEVELMKAAYGEKFQLVSIDNSQTIFSIELERSNVDQNGSGNNTNTYTTTLRIVLPELFPKAKLSLEIDSQLPNASVAELKEIIRNSSSISEEFRSFDACQLVQEYLDTWEPIDCNSAGAFAKKSPDSNSEYINRSGAKVVEVKIARCLIYFHHIMSATKKKEIVDNAVALRLSGIAKYGFPGIVIVEGEIDNVYEYIKCIQRLRWQQMVVRGEEIDTVRIDTDDCEQQNSKFSTSRGNYLVCDVVDSHRKMGKGFSVVETMSDVGSTCKNCGVHELFMTAMKKFPQENGP